MARGCQYSEATKIGVIVTALNTTVAQAAQAHKVPVRTIYGWFAEVGGGLAQIREVANEATQHEILKTAQAVCDEIRSRIATMPAEELAAIYRELLGQSKPDPKHTQLQDQRQLTSVTVHVHPNADPDA